ADGALAGTQIAPPCRARHVRMGRGRDAGRCLRGRLDGVLDGGGPADRRRQGARGNVGARGAGQAAGWRPRRLSDCPPGVLAGDGDPGWRFLCSRGREHRCRTPSLIDAIDPMIRRLWGGPCASRRMGAAVLFAAAWLAAPPVLAQDAAQWLARVAQAARSLNYTGTVVYQSGPRVETFRLAHLNEGGQEWEKLLSLDGPAREIVRSGGEVRYYFPDAKIVRIEPRTFRNVFPSLSAEQIKNLAQYYAFRIVAGERIAGHTADIVVFEPKDGLRYGHKFWSDAATGLLLKARLLNEKGEVVEQFAFTDVAVKDRKSVV